jgi:outer membrane protein assembly factor BamE
MPSSANKIPHRLAVLLLCAAMSACSWNFPYSIPIQQGNVITVEMLQELELGMDKRKVRFVLGTPLVTDAFHQERWDYFYSYEHGFDDRVQQRASLFFEGEKLVRIDADIDSRIDFHTVTDVSENVLIVPKKKKGGFFAALTPAFVEREEEKAREAEIERTLDTGFNDPQPGSESPGEASGVADPAVDAALAAPAVIGPGLGDATTPSERYAPNSSTEFEPGPAWRRSPRRPKANPATSRISSKASAPRPRPPPPRTSPRPSGRWSQSRVTSRNPPGTERAGHQLPRRDRARAARSRRASFGSIRNGR